MKVILEGGNKALIGLINELKLKMRRNKIKYSYVSEVKQGRPKVEKVIEPVKIEEKEEIKIVENEKPGRKKIEKKTQSKSKK